MATTASVQAILDAGGPDLAAIDGIVTMTGTWGTSTYPAQHGRDKAEKRAAREARARLEQLVDGHRLDNDAPATPDLDLPDARAPEDAPEVAPEAEPADQ